MPAKVCVFDAYGTLFDVSAAARAAAGEPGGAALAESWPQLAALWRDKQLQYTWLRTITGDHADFRQVTAEALDHALDASGLDDADLRARLLALYDRLAAFPDVSGMLSALTGAGRRCAILSNGAPGMLRAAVASAGIGGYLDRVISVEEVGVFKPDPRVYDLVGQHFGTRPDEVLFVSANGWDAAAAAGRGFASVWVNRAGAPLDRLPWRPSHVVTDLSALPDLAARL